METLELELTPLSIIVKFKYYPAIGRVYIEFIDNTGIGNCTAITKSMSYKQWEELNLAFEAGIQPIIK